MQVGLRQRAEELVGDGEEGRRRWKACSNIKPAGVAAATTCLVACLPRCGVPARQGSRIGAPIARSTGEKRAPLLATAAPSRSPAGAARASLAPRRPAGSRPRTRSSRHPVRCGPPRPALGSSPRPSLASAEWTSPRAGGPRGARGEPVLGRDVPRAHRDRRARGEEASRGTVGPRRGRARRRAGASTSTRATRSRGATGSRSSPSTTTRRSSSSGSRSTSTAPSASPSRMHVS